MPQNYLDLILHLEVQVRVQNTLYCYNARKAYSVKSTKKQQHYFKWGSSPESWVLVLDYSSLATPLKKFFFKWKSLLNLYKNILNAVYAMILLLLIIISSIPLRVNFCFFFFFLIKLNWLMPRGKTVKTGIFELFLTNLFFLLFSFTFTLQSTNSSILIVISLCTFSNKLLNRIIYFSNHMYLLCKCTWKKKKFS